ncbi:hypothetical protein V8B97DRAFT_2022240 [Scleroderma yunnanense]
MSSKRCKKTWCNANVTSDSEVLVQAAAPSNVTAELDGYCDGEEIDINVSSSSSDDQSHRDSDESENEVVNFLNSQQGCKPMALHAPTKQKQQCGSGTSVADPPRSYDPLNCCCANAPFMISSSATLDEIHLSYHLDSDKLNVGATSIHMDDELSLFKTRMRRLIVPPLLANGWPSNCVPKSIHVIFEDPSADEDHAVEPSISKGNKIVSPSLLPLNPHSSFWVTVFTRGTNCHKELIDELKKQWTCEIHSKGSSSPTYCYSPSGGNICYVLTLANISYWAFEIMNENATVNRKPPMLYLHDSRPHTHSTRAQLLLTQTDHSNPTFSGRYKYSHPFPFVLPWGPLGYQGSNGAFYAPGQPVELPLPTVLQTSQPAVHFAPSQNPTASHDSDVLTPDIVSWFLFLDQHEWQNKNGICFALYGPIVREKGFIYLSQLTQEWVNLTELQDLLSINFGTAILIMQYAAQDLEAAKLGQLILPSQS